MIVDEMLLPGPEAIERVTGHRPHYSQFFRWTQYGLQTRSGSRTRLEFVKAGSKRLTSEPAVRRFLSAHTAAATSDDVVPDRAPKFAARRKTAIDGELDREGL